MLTKAKKFYQNICSISVHGPYHTGLQGVHHWGICWTLTDNNELSVMQKIMNYTLMFDLFILCVSQHMKYKKMFMNVLFEYVCSVSVLLHSSIWSVHCFHLHQNRWDVSIRVLCFYNPLCCIYMTLLPGDRLMLHKCQTLSQIYVFHKKTEAYFINPLLRCL